MAAIKREHQAALQAPDAIALKSTLHNGAVLDEENVSSASSEASPTTPSIRIPKPEPESSTDEEAATVDVKKSFKDVAKALPLKESLKKENAPKMADFFSDIHARIESLKRPKNAKPKVVEADKGEEEVRKGPEHDGEIYGEIKGNTRSKKVLFGIGKKGVERAVVRFRDKPVSKPLHVGFDFPNSSLHHKQVYTILQQHLSTMEDARVVSLQYQDRNVLFGARTVENRWLIEVNNLAARDELLSAGIIIFNRKVKVHKYDDLQDEDYVDYVKMLKTQKNIRDLNERPQMRK
ncbi:hypothetical protein CAPTEDRAFT_204729 [Capitella teleta]|uniref:Uncharacterized protein n=1 Tax=Capitella teleta TaxID=283909 RepID=R7V133_CAPTE|nr:hypothetical protein CAPTEDRAFT_204729 [Capitella teleta]|eukprot:ELU12182.1 hypothetical protein CAPTEDRAFT_204729 [Capitella teleta]